LEASTGLSVATPAPEPDIGLTSLDELAGGVGFCAGVWAIAVGDPKIPTAITAVTAVVAAMDKA
jgi:hypothetical protein